MCSATFAISVWPPVVRPVHYISLWPPVVRPVHFAISLWPPSLTSPLYITVTSCSQTSPLCHITMTSCSDQSIFPQPPQVNAGCQRLSKTKTLQAGCPSSCLINWVKALKGISLRVFFRDCNTYVCRQPVQCLQKELSCKIKADRLVMKLGVLASEGWWEAWQPPPKVTRSY